MEPAKRRRWLILLAALGATLAASFYRNEESLFANVRKQVTPVREDRSKVVDVPPKPEAQTAVIPERLESRVMDSDVEDAFGVKSWAPPPPPPPPPPKPVAQLKPQPPPPPLKPTAPPLPYKYLGRLEEGTVATIFLGAGDRNFAVKPGATFDGSYRLDAAQSGLLTFTYLPLNIQQTLPVAQPN